MTGFEIYFMIASWVFAGLSLFLLTKMGNMLEFERKLIKDNMNVTKDSLVLMKEIERLREENEILKKREKINGA